MKELRQVKQEIEKTSAKNVAETVSLPTHEDLERITKIIQNYRRASIKSRGVDEVAQARDDARRNHLIAGNNYDRYSLEYNLVNKGSNMRHVFELPEGLIRAISREYPLIFTTKKHFAWFAKNFKELRLSDKY